MASYDTWLSGTPEHDILHLMGLFDRPVPGGAIRKLREPPAIPGLTDKLENLPDAQWQFALQHLRDLRLLSKKDDLRPDTLDQKSQHGRRETERRRVQGKADEAEQSDGQQHRCDRQSGGSGPAGC